MNSRLVVSRPVVIPNPTMPQRSGIKSWVESGVKDDLSLVPDEMDVVIGSGNMSYEWGSRFLYWVGTDTSLWR